MKPWTLGGGPGRASRALLGTTPGRRWRLGVAYLGATMAIGLACSLAWHSEAAGAADTVVKQGHVLFRQATAAVSVLDASSGRVQALPPSERARGGWPRDRWHRGANGRSLIRVDEFGGVAILAWPSLELLVSFRPQLGPADERLYVGGVRMSPDEQWLAATLATSDDESRLRVFDRSGRLLARGPKMQLNRTPSFDWLPDGRLVFIDQEAPDYLNFYDLRAGQVQSVPIRFPTEVEDSVVGLAVSPDGRQIALNRITRFRRSTDVTEHAVLYRFGLEGGLGEALTVPAPAILNSANGLKFWDLTWSPDGQRLAMTVGLSAGAYGAVSLESSCPMVALVPVRPGQLTPVVGLSSVDPAAMRVAIKGKPMEVLETCGDFQWWGR